MSGTGRLRRAAARASVLLLAVGASAAVGPQAQAVPPSADCTGDEVVDGYVGNVFLQTRTSWVDAQTVWVCYRMDDGGALQVGGKFVVKAAGISGSPAVDANVDACATTPGNTMPGPHPLQRGQVGDTGDDLYLSYLVDGYTSNGQAWVCLALTTDAGDVARRRVAVPVPLATTPSVTQIQDPPGAYRPARDTQTAVPSATCQNPLSGSSTEYVNFTSAGGDAWLATWQESVNRLHICTRFNGGLSAGGRLTVDTGLSSVSPVASASTTSTAWCDRVVTSQDGIVDVAILRGSANNPAAVCVVVNGAQVAVTAGATGTAAPPNVTWTADR